MSIYFIAIFSFSIFFVPVLLKTIGITVFLLSGAISLLAIYLFSEALFKVVPNRYKKSEINIRNAVASVFIVINILYFSNLIPPIPLAMKDSGVYYSIERVGESYRAIGEEKRWYELIPFLLPETIHLQENSSLYVFSSVFAPTDLNTRIIHDWQYFDGKKGDWISVSKISFFIRGGRDKGYRGFSKKENVFEGKWRVDVKTERGQIIGRVRFNVEIESPGDLEFRTL